MKNAYSLLVFLLSFIFISCSSDEKAISDQPIDGLEIIKVDLSEAREGKLSEFFEPDIEYIWLKDDVEDAQLGGLNKVFFHEDKIYTLDIFGCKCIKIFDSTGKYFSKIRAYGEGPEKYLDLDDAIIVNNEVLLSGVHPPKLMWFSLDGNFLREEKLAKHLGSAVFSEDAQRYYFFSYARGPGEYWLESVDVSFQDTLKLFPYKSGEYYGRYSSRNSFINNENTIYFGRAFNDTIMEAKGPNFEPKFVFDFGKYAQSIDEMKKIEKNSTSLEELDFINKRAKLHFAKHEWYVSEAQFYSRFKYETDSYNVFFNRKEQMAHVIEGRLKNDIDESYDPYSFAHRFYENKIGFYMAGKTIFKILQEKKAELGQAGFEEYVRGKGKNFAQVAFAAKDSENPVLIVYTVKK